MPAPGPDKLGAFLKTRNGKIAAGAAGAGTIGLAVFARYRAKNAAASPQAGTVATGVNAMYDPYQTLGSVITHPTSPTTPTDETASTGATGILESGPRRNPLMLRPPSGFVITPTVNDKAGNEQFISMPSDVLLWASGGDLAALRGSAGD